MTAEVDYLNGGSGDSVVSADNCYHSAGTINNASRTITVPGDIKYICVMEGYISYADVGSTLFYDYHDNTHFMMTDTWQAQTTSISVHDISPSAPTGIRSINGDTVEIYFATGGNDHWYKIAIFY